MIEEQIRRLSKLHSWAVNEHNMLYNFHKNGFYGYYFRCELVDLIFSIYKIDRNILKDTFTELGTFAKRGCDYSRIDFDELERLYCIYLNEDKLINMAMGLRGIYLSIDDAEEWDRRNGKLVAFWLKMLEELELIPDSVEFYQSVLDNCRSDPHMYITGTRKPKDSQSIERMEALNNASQSLLKEFILSGLNPLDSIKRKYPSALLAEINWHLQEMRSTVLWKSEATGPYIIEVGHDWASSLERADLNGYLGILSLSFTPEGIKCNFKYEIGNSVRTVSWTRPLDTMGRYEDALFNTWIYYSGKYFEYPKAETQAYWAVGGEAVDDMSWVLEGLERPLANLSETEEYRELAASIKRILRIESGCWYFDHIPWTLFKELDELTHKLWIAIDRIGRSSKDENNGQEAIRSESTEIRALRRRKLEEVRNAKIPPEHRTKPMSISEMAGYWGIESRKLSKFIKKRTIKAIPLGREDYIFDTSVLSKDTIEALRKAKKV